MPVPQRVNSKHLIWFGFATVAFADSLARPALLAVSNILVWLSVVYLVFWNLVRLPVFCLRRFHFIHGLFI